MGTIQRQNGTNGAENHGLYRLRSKNFSLDYAREGPAAEFLRNLAREIRENPVPLLRS